MDWITIKHFFNSTFVNTLALAVVGVFAYWIGRIQANIQDSIELYASFGIIENLDSKNRQPIVHIQNIGSRVVYFDSYEFNGIIYELNGQVRPSTYSNAINNFYRIELPTNGVSHVSILIFFHDIEKRNWKSEIICDFNNGWWEIKTYPRERV